MITKAALAVYMKARRGGIREATLPHEVVAALLWHHKIERHQVSLLEMRQVERIFPVGSPAPNFLLAEIPRAIRMSASFPCGTIIGMGASWSQVADQGGIVLFAWPCERARTHSYARIENPNFPSYMRRLKGHPRCHSLHSGCTAISALRSIQLSAGFPHSSCTRCPLPSTTISPGTWGIYWSCNSVFCIVAADCQCQSPPR